MHIWAHKIVMKNQLKKLRTSILNSCQSCICCSLQVFIYLDNQEAFYSPEKSGKVVKPWVTSINKEFKWKSSAWIWDSQKLHPQWKDGTGKIHNMVKEDIEICVSYWSLGEKVSEKSWRQQNPYMGEEPWIYILSVVCGKRQEINIKQSQLSSNLGLLGEINANILSRDGSSPRAF